MVMKKQSKSHWIRQISDEPAENEKTDAGLSEEKNEKKNAEDSNIAAEQTETEQSEEKSHSRIKALREIFYTTKRSKMTAGILTAALLLTLLFFHDLFFEAESGGALFAAAVAGSLLIGLLTVFHVKVSNRAAKMINPIIFFLVPIASMCMAECINGKFIYDFSYVSFFCNYLVYLILYAVVMVFSGSFKMPIVVMTPIIFIFAVTCSVVLTFRGTPLVPMDIVTISTGLAVASNYSYTVPYTLILGIIIFLAIMILGIRMTRIRFKHRGSYICRAAALVFILAVVLPFYTTDFAANHGVKPDFWNQTRGYHNSGTVLNFFLNTKYLIIEKPVNYNSSEVTSIVNGLLEENQDDKGILASANDIQKRAEERRLEEEKMRQQAEAAAGQNSDAAATDENNTAAGNGDNAADNVNAAAGNDTAAVAADDDGNDGNNRNNDDNAAANADKDDPNGEPDDGLGNGFDENGNPLPNTGLDTDLAVRCTSDTDQPKASARKKKNQAPNLICIMNETYSDLRVLGPLSTNKDYMPFTRSLTKNTIKGNLYMPVTGAGTSNSEFEFLTGNTIAFLTAGSNAYELYIKSQLPSLAYTLASQNYARSALHVYYRTSWQRDVNYPLLGFERFDSIESFIDNEAIDEYRNGNKSFYAFQEAVNAQYPGENVLLRRFVSDNFDYKLLEQMYEERDTSKPFFVFNVTMQNHGSYDSSYTNFDQQIKLTSTDEYYPAANRYLSLIYESDQAFKNLVEYFSKVKEPTIILMFGDHQPNIETEFVESLLGDEISDLSLEQRQKRFITPFILWANYNIEESYIDKMSSNYLSTLLLQTAGLKTTKYNDYLSALYRYIPVIDSSGYITAEDEYYTFDEKSDYTDLLKGYEKVQYNNLFDTIGRHNELFYIQPDDTAG